MNDALTSWYFGTVDCVAHVPLILTRQLTLMTLTCGLASGAAEKGKKGRMMLSIPKLALGWAVLTGLLWTFVIAKALKVSLLWVLPTLACLCAQQRGQDFHIGMYRRGKRLQTVR